MKRFVPDWHTMRGMFRGADLLKDPADDRAAEIVRDNGHVSFSDAFAIALAQSENGSVITGDDEIRQCGLVPVDWVGA